MVYVKNARDSTKMKSLVKKANKIRLQLGKAEQRVNEIQRKYDECWAEMARLV